MRKAQSNRSDFDLSLTIQCLGSVEELDTDRPKFTYQEFTRQMFQQPTVREHRTLFILLVTPFRSKPLHNMTCLLGILHILLFYLKSARKKLSTNFHQLLLACSTENLCCKQEPVPALTYKKALYIQIFTLEIMNADF